MKKSKFLLMMTAAAVMILVSGCLCSRTCPQAAQEDHLQIGWGKRSLAKDGPVPITGQFYLRISQGNFTPVIAQALVLSNNKDSVIFVSADMVSVHQNILNSVCDLLKKENPAIPAKKIILNATHTHAGPSGAIVPTDYPRQAKVISTPEMQKFIARQIADAIKDAWNTRAPGSIAYGYGFATTGHSRRTVYFDDTGKRLGSTTGQAVNGKGRMYGKTNDAMFDGYEAGTDSFINLLYTFDKKGKLSGAVINVPCPSQTNESVWMLHASFWHNVRTKLAEKYGREIGVIAQSAAAGDLSPRQLHYHAAELRRYRLKYADKILAYCQNPMKHPKRDNKKDPVSKNAYEVTELMRAEDIANRITTAFDEVLSWAQKDKKCTPVIKHEVKTVKLARRMFPASLVEQEKKNYKNFLKQKYIEGGDQWDQLTHNSSLRSRRNRINGVITRSKIQAKEPGITTVVHAVRIGDIAFASNRFELFLDYMHRIQARSPFEQTFIVQLVTDEFGIGSYLATEKAVVNKGYSASPYCNQVSPKGGQELVNETVSLLKKISK